MNGGRQKSISRSLQSTHRPIIDWNLQVENEDPQPQVVLAFGLRMTN
jgi:hypothetical protein